MLSENKREIQTMETLCQDKSQTNSLNKHTCRRVIKRSLRSETMAKYSMIIYATSLLPNPFTPSGRLTLALIYYSGYVVLLQESRVPLEPLTRVRLGPPTRVPLGFVTLHPDYSPMLF